METMNKTKIDYPCQWSYRIIGDDEQLLSDAAAAAVGDKQFTMLPNNYYDQSNYPVVFEDQLYERLARVQQSINREN